MTVTVTFEPLRHEYRVGGVIVPHVTGIIRALSGYAGVPAEALRKAAERGDAVHYATHLSDLDDLDETSLPIEIVGYVAAWRLLVEETGFRVIASEARVDSARYRYAGTLDRVGTFSRLKHMRPSAICEVDLKSVATLMAAVGPQTAGYMQAWNEQHPRKKRIEYRFAAHLRADGTYRLHECTDPSDWSVFLSALTISNWQRRHKQEEQ